MSTIFFGPWIGEFGYELSYWIGECRAIRDRYPNHKAVASSYFGRGRLYDFVDEFLPHSIDSINTAQICMASGTDAIFHQDVYKYLAMPDCINIFPGSFYEGLLLGGADGHAKIKESVLFQKPKTLIASETALEKVTLLAKDKPIISILCRDLIFSGHYIHKWPEQYWLEMIHRLQLDEFCVVLLLPGYSSKPSYLTNMENGIINLWKIFKDSENFVDLQIAFLNKSICSIATVSGAAHYGYLTGNPFLYMLAAENEYKQLYDVWKSRYNNKVQYLIGNGTVENISVENCYKKLQEMIHA